MTAQTQSTTLQSLLSLSAIRRASGADVPGKVISDLGTDDAGKHYVMFDPDPEMKAKGFPEGPVLTEEIEPTTTRDAALWYAAAYGWAVFPLHTPTGNPSNPCSCNRRRCKNFSKHTCHDRKCDQKGKHTCHQDVCDNVGKHPRTINGLKDATTDPKKIAEWWTMWSDANVGVVTGAVSGIVVVDIDPAKGGTKTRSTIEEHGKRKLPKTKTAKTGGDGLHLVFKHPGSEIKNSASKIGPGLDIRGDGGYIVAAPSVHASGKKYQWLDGAELIDAPQWLVDLAQKTAPARKVTGPVGDSIPDGQRDDTLTSLAGSMRRRGMGVEEIYAALLVTNENRCDPPLPTDDVRKIAESVSRYAPAPDRDSEPLPEPPEWMNDAPKPGWWDSQPTKAPAPQGKPSIKEVCIADVEMKPIDWLWEGRIARGCVTLLEGIEGEGKSTVLCAIATAISRGTSGLKDMLLDGPGNVLWLSAEDNVASVLKPRLLAAGADETRIFAVGEAFTFDDPGVELVRGMIERRNPIMVVIDPVFAYTKGDPSKVSDVRPITSKLKQLAEEFNCAVILVRHVGKSKGLGDPRAAGLYSIEWRAAARSVLLCGSDPNFPQAKALTQTKSNNGELSPGLGYRIEKDPTSPSGARFSWTGESNLTAKRILQMADNENERSEKADAETFLRGALAAGEQKAIDIFAEGKEEGISADVLKKAKGRLKIETRREGFGKGSVCYWRLPEETSEVKDETLEDNLVIGSGETDPSIECKTEQNRTLWIDSSKESTYSDETPIECGAAMYVGDDPLHTLQRRTLWEKDADKSNKENGLLIGCEIGQVRTLCGDPIHAKKRRTKGVSNETLETHDGL